MAKIDSTQEAAPVIDSAPAAATAAVNEAFMPLALEEFCTRLSGVDRRVEMIGAFSHTEAVAGRVKDTEAAYRARFDAFLTQPA